MQATLRAGGAAPSLQLRHHFVEDLVLLQLNAAGLRLPHRAARGGDVEAENGAPERACRVDVVPCDVPDADGDQLRPARGESDPAQRGKAPNGVGRAGRTFTGRSLSRMSQIVPSDAAPSALITTGSRPSCSTCGAFSSAAWSLAAPKSPSSTARAASPRIRRSSAALAVAAAAALLPALRPSPCPAPPSSASPPGRASSPPGAGGAAAGEP